MSIRSQRKSGPLTLAVLLAGALTVMAAPSPEPDAREFWVPQKHLAEVLKSSPKAVLLSADQYATLLRDSRPRQEAVASPPPVPAVLTSVRYEGTPGDRFVSLRAEIGVECLTAEWTEVPLELHPRWLGAVTLDGQAALQTAGDPGQDGARTVLAVRGAGPHRVTIDFAVPVEDEAGRRSLTLMAPGAAGGQLRLTVPDAVKLDSRVPFTRQGGEAVFALPPQPGPFRISWSSQDVAPLPAAAVFQSCDIRYELDTVRLMADLGLGWHSTLRPLPGQLVLPLPADTTVLGVDGPEIRQWTLAGDRLVVDFLPGERREATLRLALERGLNPGAGSATLTLPAPVAEGVHRTSGQFSLRAARDLRVRQVVAGALAARDDSRNADPGLFGTWVFPVLPAPPQVEVQPLQVQFAATLDTQVSLTREAVRLTRWVTLTPRDGTLFSPRLEGLLPGEEIESVTARDGSALAWRKTEGGIAFPDNTGVAAGTPWTAVVTSRLDPAGWQAMADAPLTLSLASARVPGAGKVNGYTALDFDDSLQVATTAATGLEPRDPRQFAGVLPLTGRLAWSRLDDYQLTLAVTRRAAEYDAAAVLYALPLLNSLEVEGALTLSIDRSPLKEVRVGFPAAAAASVRWDSPLLAESLLESDNIWRLRFHQETDGSPVLRFRLSMPLTDATAAAVEGAPAPERRFTVDAPVPVVPGARRLRGTVVVEANTDTELTFTASGLDALDTLRAPVLDGYTPRHRLVSAWAWPGGEPGLTIHGVRHQPGDLVSTVVDRLRLDTVVSPDGPVRQQARMEVRTAGDQYLDVVLPDKARILTLLVNEAAVKPVRNRQGGLRIPLTGSTAVIRLICESPGHPMSPAAEARLQPVTVDAAVPVLATEWNLHLPDGYSYSGFETNLAPSRQATESTPQVASLALNELQERMVTRVDFLSGGGGGVSGGKVDPDAELRWSRGEIARTRFQEPRAAVKVGGESQRFNMDGKASDVRRFTTPEVLRRVVQAQDLCRKWGVSEGEAVNRLGGMVRVGPGSRPDEYLLVVDGAEAGEAPLLANAITDAYAAVRIESDKERLASAGNVLDEKLREHEAEVADAQEAMLSLMRKYNIVDGKELALISGGRRSGETNEVDLRERVQAMTAQLEKLKPLEGDELINAAVAMGVEDDTIRNFTPQLQKDTIELDRLKKAGLDERHPKLIGLQHSLRKVKEILLAAAKSYQKLLEAEIQSIEARLASAGENTRKEKDGVEERKKYQEYANKKMRYEMKRDLLDQMREHFLKSEVDSLMPRDPLVVQEYAQSAIEPNAESAGMLFPNDSPAAAPVELTDDGTKEAEYNIGGSIASRQRLGNQNGGPDEKSAGDAGAGSPSATSLKLGSIVIDRLKFENASVEDIVTALRMKSIEADAAEPDPARKGVPMVVKSTDGARPVTVDMQNVTLLTALKTVVDIAGMRYRYAGGQVEIGPLTSSGGGGENMETMVIDVPPDFLARAGGGAMTDSEVMDPFSSEESAPAIAGKPDAKLVLSQLGIAFPDGASASFSAATGKLFIRNTQEQLDVVGALAAEMGGRAGASDREGILPLDFALPEGGRVYHFAGEYAPGAVAFRYESWERQIQWGWAWMLAGGAAFWFLARRSPWFLGLLGLLLLHFTPAVLGRPDWLPVANALVIGWAVAGLLRLLSVTWRGKRRSGLALSAGTQAAVLVAGLLSGMNSISRADEPAAPAAPEVPTVIVPYDPDAPVGTAPDRRYVDYATFEKMWAAAKANREAAAAQGAVAAEAGERGATLTSALHRAAVDGAVLRVESVYALQTRGPDWVSVPFPLPGGVRSLTLDGAPAALRDGQLLVEKAGPHTVTAGYDVALPAGWQKVEWPVPAATAGSLALSLAMDDPARPVVNAGAPLVETEAAGRRVFTATLGTASAISLERRVAAQRAGVQAGEPPLARVSSRLYLTPALERVEAAVAFIFAGQERGEFTLRLDPGLTPVRFSVPGLADWIMREEGGAQVLDLRLERAVRDEFSLTFVAERPVGALPLTESAPRIGAAAARVEQEWSVLATDDIEVRPLTAAGHQRVQFVSGAGTADEGFEPAGTWQAGGNAESLRWELRPQVPEAAATVRYALQPGAGKLELSAGMELRPAPGRDLRDLTIRVPAGVTIQGVTGDRLADWWHEDTALHVRFTAGDGAVTHLALNLTSPLPPDAAEVTFTPLVIEGFAKVEGSGLLIAPVNQEAVLRLTPETPALREVAPEETRSGFVILPPFEEKRGFVFTGSDWSAAARLTPLAARYDVDWVMDAEVRDSWVELNTRVLLSLTRGGTDRVEFTTPAGAPEFRVTGDDVRETASVVEGNVRRYTVSFQTLMTGAVLFTLSGQAPLGGNAGLPDLDFPDAARIARFVIVDNRSEGQMSVNAAGLDETPREQVSFLPAALAKGQGGARFYRARPGWTLTVSVEKLETSAGQAAVVLHADLTTSLLRNGDVWQRAVYVVQNRALQFLPVRLPDEAEVISVAVGGGTTRADRGMAAGLPVLLVPLIQTAPGELATEVTLIWRLRGEPGKAARVLDDPELPGLSVGQTFWTVQYPDGYSLDSSGGNMTPMDDRGLTVEKAMSRLSELASLRSIALSSLYDNSTRARAKRNAQNIASTYSAAAAAGKDAEEYRQIAQELNEQDIPQTEETADRRDEFRNTAEFLANGETKKQVESLNKNRKEAERGQLDGLTLNDNVAWSFQTKKEPDPAKPAVMPARSKRLSQIDKLADETRGDGIEKGGKSDSKPQGGLFDDGAAGLGGGGRGDATKRPEQPQQQAAVDDFKSQNTDYSFQNARLRRNAVDTPPAPPETPATATPEPMNGPASGAAPGARPADPGLAEMDSPADPFAGGDGDAVMDAPDQRIRTSGRTSLAAVFPEQANVLHFKKIKGDAVLNLDLSVPVREKFDTTAALRLACWVGGLCLLRWVWGRIRRRRSAAAVR